MPHRPRHRHPHRRIAVGRRVVVTLLIPLGTVGGLAAAGSGSVAASAAGQCGVHPCLRGHAVLAQLSSNGVLAAGEAPAAVAEPAISVADLIDEVFPPNARQQARAIAWCESRMEPDVVGSRNPDGTHDWGVFQLNDGGTLQSLGGTSQTALDAQWNVLAAKRLYDKRGFRPWTCRRA
jgi:hypothetical protein